jgi:hypothetical protein
VNRIHLRVHQPESVTAARRTVALVPVTLVADPENDFASVDLTFDRNLSSDLPA